MKSVASQPLIINLNLILAGSTTKKDLAGITGITYAALNNVLSGKSVKSENIKVLRIYEEDTRPNQYELIESIKQLLDSGVSKWDLCLEAQIQRQALDNILISERNCQSKLLRKLDNAVAMLEKEASYRIEVHNLVIDLIDGGATIGKISRVSNVTYRSLYGFIYNDFHIRKITLDKLFKGCSALQGETL